MLNLFGFDISYWIIWLVIAVVCLIIEGETLGLTIIWFAGGALVAMISSFFSGFAFQFVIFLVVSLVLLIFTRPIFVGKLGLGKKKTNIDSIIGEKGIVIKDINPYEVGQVKVKGQIWTAKSLHDNPLQVNTEIIVKKVEGVKLIVE